MKIDQQQVGSVAVLTVRGALIEDDAGKFSTELKRSVQAASLRLVLNLHEVPYVDSVALEGLLDVVDALDERSARLRLAAVPGTVREVLQLTEQNPNLFAEVDALNGMAAIYAERSECHKQDPLLRRAFALTTSGNYDAGKAESLLIQSDCQNHKDHQQALLLYLPGVWATSP